MECKIPQGIDYSKIPELGKEARQKLSQIRPISLGAGHPVF